MITLFAKFSGTCTCCKKSFAKGERIKWSRTTRTTLCNACAFPSAIPSGTAPCWTCKAPNGSFRFYGAVGTPVYCDACEAIHRAAYNAKHKPSLQSSRPDPVDLAYEDTCAAACGFSPFGFNQ